MDGIQMPLLIAAAALVLLAVFYVLAYNRLRRLWVKVEEGSADIDVALEKRFDLLSEELEAVKKYLQHEAGLYTSITEIRSGTRLDGRTLDRQEQLSAEALREADSRIQEQSEAIARIKERMEQSRRAGGSSPRSQKRQAKREEQLAERTASLDLASNQKVSLLAGVHRDLSSVGAGVDALAEQYPVLYSSNTMVHFQHAIADAEEHLQAARRLYNSNASVYNQLRAAFPFSLIAALHGMKKADFYETEEKKRSFTVNFD